jgi:glucose-6-phosphate 1-dehydrogenase
MPHRTSHEQAKVAEPLTLVVFGASGDLTRRKLMPAIYQLWCQGLLDERSTILGYARSDKSDASFRQELRASTLEAASRAGKPIDDAAWARFASRLFYQRGSYDDASDFAALRQRLETLANDNNVPGHCMYYLATPPGAFMSVVHQLDQAGLARRGQALPWARIVVEKPFGRDLQGARQLNTQIQGVFDEQQVYRIDHYLGKETVQNILVLRFANSIFEHLWSSAFISHVQITVAESVSVGQRGGYYDHAGALRDMVQNHMMQLLCLVAMEPPNALTPEAVRNEKVKVLETLRPIPADCAGDQIVRAHYTAGTAGGVEVPGYLQTPGVAADSSTETFVAFKAYIDNWRWAGVPFYLRTGKCLPRRCTEISVHFMEVPRVLFNRPPAGPLAPNVLRIQVQPDESIALEFQVKAPGPAMDIRPLVMDFDYEESFGDDPPTAYERLLLDAATGDATLFTRSDEVEAAWQYVTPIIEGCTGERGANLRAYVAGTWGPDAADDLIEADGHRWHLR